MGNYNQFNYNTENYNVLGFNLVEVVNEAQGVQEFRLKDNGGLLGYWKFDDTPDDSAIGNNGTWTGTPTYAAGVNGGKAASFINGRYITIPNESVFAFDKGDTFSLVISVKKSTTGVAFVMVGKSTGLFNGIGWTFGIRSADDFTRFNFTDASDVGIDVRWVHQALSDDVWHQMVLTYDGTELMSGVKMYFDGVLQTNILVLSG